MSVDIRCVGAPSSAHPQPNGGPFLTTRTLDYPELDIAGVSASYERRVSEACPEHAAVGLRLLERLPAARWTLEWHLPWWLGQAFGLDPGVSREIVLSNLLGLGSIRLQDDLADGEVPNEAREAAGTLSVALYEAALAPYRRWLEQDSRFWAYLESCMAEWRAATLDHAYLHLAARGAPLRISAYAICRLAGRLDAFPAIERCLDQGLEAMVLYDHVADWESDLDAGRWNAFVAAISRGPQVAARRARHRTTAYVAMMTTDGVATYHARIYAGMRRAGHLANRLVPAVPQLGAHFRAVAREVGEHGQTMREHYRGLGDRAADLLFQEPVDARS